jgi:hypothetical protein
MWKCAAHSGRVNALHPTNHHPYKQHNGQNAPQTVEVVVVAVTRPQASLPLSGTVLLKDTGI